MNQEAKIKWVSVIPAKIRKKFDKSLLKDLISYPRKELKFQGKFDDKMVACLRYQKNDLY